MPINKKFRERVNCLLRLLKENRYPNHTTMIREMKKLDAAGTYNISRNYCQKFFKDELLDICRPYMTERSGRDQFKRLQAGQAELGKRYALCREACCKTIMEYNQRAEKPFKRYFMVFPFVHTLTEEECKMLCNIANKGRAADIHVAIGSVDEELPQNLAMCCQEKITAPIGANTLIFWYCPCYSVTAFQ